jgi:hypothetical protein
MTRSAAPPTGQVKQSPIACAAAIAASATRGTAERLEGVGVPPARELFQQLRQHEVPIYV